MLWTMNKAQRVGAKLYKVRALGWHLATTMTCEIGGGDAN